MINKEQIEEIIAEANDEIKKFGRTSQKVSKDMINALEQLKNCNIQRVSGSYYLLKEGDYIQSGDEYREEDGSWHKTGQIDKKYNPSKHYKHRRLK